MYLPDHPVKQDEQRQRFVSTGTLPDQQRITDLLQRAHERFRGVTDGAKPQVYPALAEADPEAFGIALTGVSGAQYISGEAEAGFTLISPPRVEPCDTERI